MVWEDILMRTQQNVLTERLRQENLEFLSALQRLEEASAGPADGGEELPGALEEVRGQLAEHFRLEEQSGHLDGVRDSEPRLERAVRNLLQEHRELLRSLDALR